MMVCLFVHVLLVYDYVTLVTNRTRTSVAVNEPCDYCGSCGSAVQCQDANTFHYLLGVFVVMISLVSLSHKRRRCYFNNNKGKKKIETELTSYSPTEQPTDRPVFIQLSSGSSFRNRVTNLYSTSAAGELTTAPP